MTDEFKFPSEAASDGTRRRWFGGSAQDGAAFSADGRLVMRAGAWDLMAKEDSEEPSEDDDSVEVGKSAKPGGRRTPKIEYTEVEAAFEAIKAALKDTAKVEDLRQRVARTVARANAAAKIGQSGFSRDLMETAAGLVVEQQALALGYGRWVEERHVREVVRQTERSHRLSVCNITEFPRVIPNNVQALIPSLRDIFHTFVIVFTNPKGEQVKKRDPVLFGVIRAFPDRYYYVTDWIDEHCDLTMDKLIALGQEHLHEQWRVHQSVVEPTDEDLQALVAHVRDRHMLKPVEFTWLGRVVNWFYSLPLFKRGP